MYKPIFELGNARFFEDLVFIKGDIVWHFVFEEEYIEIHIGIISIDKVLIHSLI